MRRSSSRETSWWLPDLGWLPDPGADVRTRCAGIDAMKDGRGAAIARLAAHKLDLNQSARLSASIARAVDAGVDLSPLTSFRLAFLASSTEALALGALPAAAARYGLALSMVDMSWGQVTQQALDPTSVVNTSELDAVLVALDPDELGLSEFADAPEDRVSAALDQLAAIRRGLRQGGERSVIMQTLVSPHGVLFGSFDLRVGGSPRAMIAEFNRQLRAQAGTDVVLDIASLAAEVGASIWFEPKQWHAHKAMVAPRVVPLYADHIGRLLGAMRGRSRKCLVLDLDNTLWGGIVGDDGPDGIRMAMGDPLGEAFRAVQRAALAMHRRGVVLAVASKNDEALVTDVFRTHPDMILREQHVAVFRVNWKDKASNLAEIAVRLNLGLDALVLIDDNPVERAQVRQALPQVAVPELPDDPSRYADVLTSAGYFETVSFTAEDAARPAQYRLNDAREALRGEVRDLGEFLASLEMEMSIAPFDATGRPRIAQLINRSNQYNLTTRRYTESELMALETDASVVTLQVRLTDRFGDNGMISVVIARTFDGNEFEIDTWLMSCRVLGRRVEEALLGALVEEARARGARRLLGRYIPSGQNKLVADHYSRLGFAPASEGSSTEWTLDIGKYVRPELPIRTLRKGAET